MAGKSTENVKKWLNRGYRIYDNIKALEKAKQRAWEIATSTTSVLCERVQESHGNGTENKMTAYLKYNEQLDRDINRFMIILSEIESVIIQVENNTYRTLLIRRYLNFDTWDGIAYGMKISYRQIHRLHERALNAVKNIIFAANSDKTAENHGE